MPLLLRRAGHMRACVGRHQRNIRRELYATPRQSWLRYAHQRASTTIALFRAWPDDIDARARATISCGKSACSPVPWPPYQLSSVLDARRRVCVSSASSGLVSSWLQAAIAFSWIRADYFSAPPGIVRSPCAASAMPARVIIFSEAITPSAAIFIIADFQMMRRRAPYARHARFAPPSSALAHGARPEGAKMIRHAPPQLVLAGRKRQR